MHVHILGIAGVLMSGVARLAVQCGHTVTGCDRNFFPPVVDILNELDVPLIHNFDADQLDSVGADLYIVGNVMTRGMPIVEEILNKKLPYTSAPRWLSDNVLSGRHVMAIAGTHGKTTTTTMLTWILSEAGLNPGFLIGGIPKGIPHSADHGDSPFFVVEADEYDTSFFDKRSKFIHYRPDILLINNLEYDHTDIFRDLADMMRQYHFLMRTIPSNGAVIYPATCSNITDLLNMGCWSDRVSFCRSIEKSCDNYTTWSWVRDGDSLIFKSPSGCDNYQVSSIVGEYNCHNAMAAFLMSIQIGVDPAKAAKALSSFPGVKRRLEYIAEKDGVRFFDDFAHHPTAMKASILAAKESCAGRLWVVFEPSSNSFRRGAWSDRLFESVMDADYVICYTNGFLSWDVGSSLSALGKDRFSVFDNIDSLLDNLLSKCRRGDDIILMSNGFFAGLHQKIKDCL
ncbi:UDP-N-acetylmuramate:L-alanyl-gamma-D-glutamyl-meso-diaminopimelate ligase [Candidatus Ichthyocystis sparus]|uniref:UDP-N-acetylmuramate:L-alanyl-gamma-D-glutamyl- meso-diaminopimelate ligase n=1 Tax=Candidatus Ichthyocystis sparus TaxID=1561004 RepID=UPI000ABF6D5B|nr:UDP-N-acetylmuramate:L-alanyl-gamma-D-glutamyl-meso-diaminopimelate ligase [Candidatus Ichthyocystis sparus]